MRAVTKFPIKALKLIELANLYGVTTKTMKKWMKPFKAEIGALVGQFYSVLQVKIIVENLGPPGITLEF